MKLLSIDMENIRSYRSESVDFLDGVSLFEGDIGSGKSSILNAIEFALFGLGDLNGAHLIRIGENEAKVELELEVNGRQYLFGRTLKRRGKGVHQDTCYIVEDGVKTEYNVTDMKRRALQLLDFKEPPNPRSHSVIYRYAIFTPQEEMKEVLGQKPSDRKETLRKAFGIEQYHTAGENATELVSDIDVDMLVLKRSEKEIESIKEKIEEENKLIAELEKKITKTEEEQETLIQNKKETVKQLSDKNKELEQYNDIKGRIEIQENKKELNEKHLIKEKKRLSEIKDKIQKSKKAKENASKLLPEYKKLQENKKKLKELEPKKEAYEHTINLIKLEKQAIESAKKTLLDKKSELETRKEKQEEQIQEIKKQLENLPDLQETAETLANKTKNLEELRSKQAELTGEISGKGQEITTQQTQLTQLENEWGEIEQIGLGAECPRCQQELTAKHYKLLDKKYDKEIKETRVQIKILREEKQNIDQKFKETSKKIEELEKTEKKLNEIRLKIKALETKQEGLSSKREEYQGIKSEISETKTKLPEDNYAKEHRTELESLKTQLSELEPLAKQYTEIKKVIEELEEGEIEKTYLQNKNLADRLPEHKEQRQGSMEEIEKIEENIEEAEKQLNKLRPKLDELGNPKEKVDKLQKKLTEISNKITGNQVLVDENNERIDDAEKRIEGHDEDLERHQNNIVQSEEYGLIRRWLEEAFIPSIHNIEQNVLRRLHYEFNRLFKKWFNILLESESIEGYIDEEFTPIIDQTGYELEIDSLSGGEKTSVALAYRLALNTIVKKVTDTMQRNLLILDEPTDGFSREQLFKMRDILHDLNCEQVIMVSHEKELESVADHIYQVHKEGTVSTVTHP